MTTSAKIRLLLALLSASLILTAVISRKIYSPKKNLELSARAIENNLHKKEKYVEELIGTKQALNRLKIIDQDEKFALKLINECTVNNRIWLVTYKNKRLNYWSGIKVIPRDGGISIKEGRSFIKQQNGYYEAVKKTDGEFTAIFFIAIKNNFKYQNQYLQNTFEPSIQTDNTIQLADFEDRDVCTVRSMSGDYLFSIKNTPKTINHSFLYFEFTLWVLGFITLCFFVHSTCTYILHKRYPHLAYFALFAFISAIRLINLYLHWPDYTLRFDIFNPEHFSAGSLFPSFGDFCINLLMICWLAAFVYSNRKRLVKKQVENRALSYGITILSVVALVVISSALLQIFNHLVITSNINFDVNNVLNLSVYSLIGVVMLGVAFLIFFLLTETLLTISTKLNISHRDKLIILLSAVLAITAVSLYKQQFTMFYLLWSCIVIIRGYDIWYGSPNLSPVSFVSIVLICSLISAIKLASFQSYKEKETRKALVQELERAGDVNADQIFKNIEHDITQEPFLLNFFDSSNRNTAYLKNRFQKLYFDGYLSKFDFNLYVFDSSGNALASDKEYALNDYKDMVLYSSIKVSDYFYRENENFGFQSYFAILPVIKNEKNLGTVIISLKSKPLLTDISFPALLDDGKVKTVNKYKDYSYAFYTDNRLLTQSGNFVYSLINKDFKGQQRKYIFKVTRGTDLPWFQSLKQYDHLIYQPSPRKLIIVTREQNILLHSTTSLTFFFVMLLSFSVVVVTVRWLWLRVKLLNITDNKVRWRFRINFDQVLYKTRIQLSIMFAVVVTLFVVGLITYLSIRSQYLLQQDNTIRDRLAHIATAFQNGLSIDVNDITEESQVKFSEFANTYSSDLNLFNRRGELLISTQPKIYEYGFLARYMHAKAFVYLQRLQKSEVVNEERIARLNYKAAYVPIRNSKNVTIAYLQLPYFSNVADYNERIGSLLNAMINIYALVLILIGILAIIIARQITTPLSFIQHSLSRTIYGKKNEPIKWERNDEIGALVKEYNKMIAALDYSAQRLAQSERESAWREMAKQVAHEIKNPLTPLKLGLQLLEKSWKDKDPKFDQKFERFSKSFVEQIESLSNIASEFSAFAKMPDTRMERINLFDLLNQAVTIFKQMDNTSIVFDVPEQSFFINADRDQLLRCFNNLLKNAIEAVPPDRKRNIEIGFTFTAKTLLLSIKDNGGGIPENLRKKIFEPNFTTKSSGTGLGLAFVKNSIENAGGEVWFETATGVGTTFFLKLPAWSTH